MENPIRFVTKYSFRSKKFFRKIEQWTEEKCLVLRSPECADNDKLIDNILIGAYGIDTMLRLTHNPDVTLERIRYKPRRKHDCYFGDRPPEDHERLLVRYDNVHRLIKRKGFEDEHMRTYDLVVIDNAEDFLAVFDNIKCCELDDCKRCDDNDLDKLSYFKTILDIINCSKNLLVIDTEIGERTKQFVKRYDPVMFIHNEIDEVKKVLVVDSNLERFVSSIKRSWKNCEKVLVLSMCVHSEPVETGLAKLDIGSVPADSYRDCRQDDELLETSYHGFIAKRSLMEGENYFDLQDFYFNFYFDKIYCILADEFMGCSPENLIKMLDKMHIMNGKIECLRSPFPIFRDGTKMEPDLIMALFSGRVSWEEYCSNVDNDFNTLYKSIRENGYEIIFNEQK